MRSSTTVDDELEVPETSKRKRRSCICGKIHIAGAVPPCGRYAHYTTGHCRRCGHGRRCCATRPVSR